MLQPNLIVSALAALFPLALGFVWYNPKVFGNAWMAGAGLTQETAQKDFNMPLVFGLNFVFSFLIAISLEAVWISFKKSIEDNFYHRELQYGF